MAKLIIILGLILSLGGLSFAQPPPPPWMEVPEVGVVPEVEIVPEVEVVPEEEMTTVDILRIMFPEAVIEVEPITGALLIEAPPLLHEKIEEIIGQLDVLPLQITIEAKFVELLVADIHELGIDLDIHDIRVAPTLEEGAVDIITDWTDFPLEVGAISIGVTRLDPTAFSAVLRALEKQGKVNVLSAPRVTTLSGQLATISIIRTIPYVYDVEVENVGTAEHPIWLTTYEIEEEEVGVLLTVTPTVPEGTTLITLDITPTVNVLVDRIPVFADVDPAYGWPVIDTRTTTTSLTIESGESIVLGGLIRSEEQVIERKVPLLGDIPLLGHLFRHEYSREEKSNLIIFITAYLVSPTGEKIVARR